MFKSERAQAAFALMLGIAMHLGCACIPNGQYPAIGGQGLSTERTDVLGRARDAIALVRAGMHIDEVTAILGNEYDFYGFGTGYFELYYRSQNASVSFDQNDRVVEVTRVP